MNPIVTTPPTGLPIALSDVKDQLSIDPSVTDYDVRLTGLIGAATRAVEKYLGRSLMQRSYVGYMDWWPTDARGQLRRHVDIDMPPLISVDFVTTYDDSDVATVMPAAQYLVDTYRSIGRIVLRRGQIWPLPYRVANGVQIAWTAGYSAANLIDPDILLAIRVMVGMLNEQRGDETDAPDVPPVVMRLLPPPVWLMTQS